MMSPAFSKKSGQCKLLVHAKLKGYQLHAARQINPRFTMLELKVCPTSCCSNAM